MNVTVTPGWPRLVGQNQDQGRHIGAHTGKRESAKKPEEPSSLGDREALGSGGISYE